MSRLLSGRHVSVPWRYTNMAAPYWATLVSAKYFDEYFKFGKTCRLKNVERCRLYLSPKTSQFLDFATQELLDYQN